MKKLSLFILMVVSILPLSSLNASEQAKEKQPEVNQQLDQDQNVVINANNFVVSQGQKLDAQTAIKLANANVENDSTNLVVNERQLQAINDNQDGGFFTLTFSCGETNKTVNVVKLGATVVGNDEVFITARDVTYTQEIFNNIVNTNDVTQIISDATAQAINLTTSATDTAFNVTFNDGQVTFTKEDVSKVVNVNIVDEAQAPASREAASTPEATTLSAQNKVLYQEEAQQQIKTVEDLKTVLGLTSTPDKNTEVTVDAGVNFNKIKNGAISYDGYDITFTLADQTVTKKLYIVDKENCAISKDQKTFIRLFDTYVNTIKYILENQRPVLKGDITPEIKNEENFYQVNYALVVSDGNVLPYTNNKVSLKGFEEADAKKGQNAKIGTTLTYTTEDGEVLKLDKTTELVSMIYQEINGKIYVSGDGATADHLGKLYFEKRSFAASPLTIQRFFENGDKGFNQLIIDKYKPHFLYRGVEYKDVFSVQCDAETKENIMSGKISVPPYNIKLSAAVPNTDFPNGYATGFVMVSILDYRDDVTAAPAIVMAPRNYVDFVGEATNKKQELINKMEATAYYSGAKVNDITVSISDEDKFNNGEVGDYQVTFTAKYKYISKANTVTYSIVPKTATITQDHFGYILISQNNIAKKQSEVIGRINQREDIASLLGITAMYDGEKRVPDIEVLTGSFHDIKEGQLGSYRYNVKVSASTLPDYMLAERIFTIYDDQTTESNGYAIRADDITKHVSELPLTPDQALELSHAKAWKLDGTNNNVPLKVNETQLSGITAVGDYPLDLITDEQPTNTRNGDVVVGNPGIKTINVHVYDDPTQPVVKTPVVDAPLASQIPTGVKNVVVGLVSIVLIASVALVITKRNRK